MTPSPRHPLPDHVAETAYQTAFDCARRHGIWRPHFRLGLDLFARMVSQYVRMAAAHPEHAGADLDHIRLLVRRQAFQWHLVDEERPPEIKPGALDPDIARIGGVGLRLVEA